jgi:asparagine synthase (glutamine-hydrolysing)
MWIGGITGSDFMPVEHQKVWGFPRPVWAVGHTGAPWLRIASSAALNCRLVVAGDCYATDTELNSGLSAVARADWRALTNWPGSYWVACDDGRETIVLTDVAGSRPVYYTQHEGGTAWATQAAPLADLTGTGPDYQALAAWMTCPAVPEAYPGGTTFAGVRRLPGGCALRLYGNGEARVTRYEPENENQSFEGAANSLRAALVTAVSARGSRTRKLSSDFSGGLDSTTLALLAARAGFQVLAVTHEDPVIVNDDSEYAKRLVLQQHSVIHESAGVMRFTGVGLPSASPA